MPSARFVPVLLIPIATLPARALHAQSRALDARQRAVLAAGVDEALVVPDLPAGWGIDRVEVDVGSDGAARYRIVHRSDDGRCFAIEGGPARGFGGPVPPNDRAVPTPGLPIGAGVRIFWTTGPGEGGPFPARTVLSDWIALGGLAHRFVSPSDPLGGCEAVRPGEGERLVGRLAPLGRSAGAEAAVGAETAVGPVAADGAEAVVGPVAVDGPETAAGDPAIYRRLAWNDPTIEAREGEAPAATALRILDVLGLGLDPDEPYAEAPFERSVDPIGVVADDWSVVVVTREGGGDDSVAGVRYRVAFRPIGEGRLEFRIGRAFRCHEGRGHRRWAPGFCL